ncbi:desmoplakin [Helicoverpa armigera multiple nucleopolyhedrovirus]|uniref:Desmoplakin n=1 Tax=Mamestra brassicae nuclear polyhedrosis virus TaxID=78219 RepID=A0A077CZ77_NPVMB|nr:desmoplakin [Helicoverpa armigera multiple nucleopolyhedrovirus]AIL25184.1 desmoplakin [Mamestra brassicae multiple nucleopolyhedrovirus]
MSDRYRTPRYKNTDVSANTVHNLLQTINNMSQRSKNQAYTDEILDRVRSIILVYRPHLINRSDLQVPELVMEALKPDSANSMPHAITHNFNYKYDYNTNMPNGYNPLLQQHQQQQAAMMAPHIIQPTNENTSTMPTQTINIHPNPGNTPIITTPNYMPQQQQQQPPPPPPPSSQTVAVPQPEELIALNESYLTAVRSPTIEHFQALLSRVTIIITNYFNYDIIINSLKYFKDFEQYLNKNIADLLSCLARNTQWTLTNNTEICDCISIVINSYCKMASFVMGQQFVLTGYITVQNLTAITTQIEQTLTTYTNTTFQSQMQAAQQPLQERIQQLEIQHNEKVAEYNNIYQTYNQLTLQHNELQSNNNALQTQVQLMTNAFNNIKTYLETNNIAVELNTFEDTSTEAIKILDNTIQENKVLKQRITAAELTNDDTVKNLNEKLIDTDIQLTSLKLKYQDYDDLRAKNTALENKLGELQKEKEVLLFTINELRPKPVSNVIPTRPTSIILPDSTNVPAALASNQITEPGPSEITEPLNTLISTPNQTALSSGRPINLPNLPTAAAVMPSPSLARRSSIPPSQRQSNLGRERRNSNLSKVVKNQRAVIDQKRAINAQLSNKNRNISELLQSVKLTVSRLSQELESTKTNIETLSNNQAALSPNDLKMLNNKNTQDLRDKIVRLQAENQSVRDYCNIELEKASSNLKETLIGDKERIESEISSLAVEIEPLQTRVQETIGQINTFQVQYEQLARNMSK